MPSTEKLIRVFTGSMVEAKIVESRLRQLNIPVMIKDSFQSGIPTSGSTEDVDLLIEEMDLNAAEDVIADLNLR